MEVVVNLAGVVVLEIGPNILVVEDQVYAAVQKRFWLGFRVVGIDKLFDWKQMLVRSSLFFRLNC